MRDVCPQCGGPRKDEAIVWSGATVWFRCSLCEWVWRSSLQLIVGNLLSSAHLPVQPPVEQVEAQPEAMPQPEVAPDETVWLSDWFRCSRSEWVWPGALAPVAVGSLVRDAHPPVQPPVEQVETLLEVMPQPEAKVETQPVALPQPEAKVETQAEALPQGEAKPDDARSDLEKVQLLGKQDPVSSQKPRAGTVDELSEWTDIDGPVAVITGRLDAVPSPMLDVVPPTLEELPPTLEAEQPTPVAGRSTMADGRSTIDDARSPIDDGRSSSPQLRLRAVDDLSEWTEVDGPVAVIGAQFADVPPTMEELSSTLAAEEPTLGVGRGTIEDRRSPIDDGRWTKADRRWPIDDGRLPHDDLSEWTDTDAPVAEIVGEAAGSEAISNEQKTVWQRIRSAKLLGKGKRSDSMNPPIADSMSPPISDSMNRPVADSTDRPMQEAVSTKTDLTVALDRMITNVEGTETAFVRLQEQLASVEHLCDQLIHEPDQRASTTDHRPSPIDDRPSPIAH